MVRDAPLAIPFHQLRFSGSGEQRWRILVRRYVPRTHQVLDSALCPREANPVTAGGLVVSRFGALEGVTDLDPEPPWSGHRPTSHKGPASRIRRGAGPEARVTRRDLGR